MNVCNIPTVNTNARRLLECWHWWDLLILIELLHYGLEVAHYLECSRWFLPKEQQQPNTLQHSCWCKQQEKGWTWWWTAALSTGPSRIDYGPLDQEKSVEESGCKRKGLAYSSTNTKVHLHRDAGDGHFLDNERTDIWAKKAGWLPFTPLVHIQQHSTALSQDHNEDAGSLVKWICAQKQSSGD